jgi:hypothetical protein
MGCTTSSNTPNPNPLIRGSTKHCLYEFIHYVKVGKSDLGCLQT